MAVLTTGILAMEKTFMGVIELDPQQLLEDGIRKQARGACLGGREKLCAQLGRAQDDKLISITRQGRT